MLGRGSVGSAFKDLHFTSGAAMLMSWHSPLALDPCIRTANIYQTLLDTQGDVSYTRYVFLPWQNGSEIFSWRWECAESLSYDSNSSDSFFTDMS